jgi:hypothetical protein
MRIIIPCAGRSSRFPTARPKYLLTMPDGKPMFMHAAAPYYGKYPVTFVLIKEHCALYAADTAIRNAYGSTVDIVILDEFTGGPAETIYLTVKDWTDTPFMSVDCDCFYDVTIPAVQNFITSIDISNYPTLSNIAAKSFIIEENGIIRNIIEKRVVSGNICVGGYGFESSNKYAASYESIRSTPNGAPAGELFISHIVKHLIDINKDIFMNVEVDAYVDCGTYADFIDHAKKHMTIFCDIDGVVFKNQSEYFANNYNTPVETISDAVAYLLDKQQAGATIIFTTARLERFKTVTESNLTACGFTNYRVIYDLPHSPRLLINDVSTTNPWPSANAINVPRDDNNFWKAIK